jgi:hypothetical protein
MKKVNSLFIVLGFFLIDSFLKYLFNFGLIDGDLFSVNVNFMISTLGD